MLVLETKKITRLHGVLLSIATLLSLTLGLLVDIKAGYSAFIGGGICICANLLFALCLFAPSGAKQAKAIARGFFWGGSAKLLLTMALFAATFCWVPVAPSYLFVGFIVTQCGLWLTPWLII